MLEYLRKRQGEAKAQETEKEQAAVPAGAGNQAMLSMLKAQVERGEVQPASGGTPLAEAMRAKFERHFGLPMDDVRVHRNSDEPAKFDAGAYTYGTDIFIGPGQEDLLNHEMTHVAQQKLGQVRPTGMEHGMAVNRSPALEHSADAGSVAQTAGTAAGPVVQCGDDDEDQSVLEPPAKKRRRVKPSGATAARQDVAVAALLGAELIEGSGTHKRKKKEQQRLKELSPSMPDVTGMTHQSEHAVGFAAVNHSGRPRRKMRKFEGELPAYQEATSMHRNHIGTGSGTKEDVVTRADGSWMRGFRFGMPAISGQSADEFYRAHQYKAVSEGRVGNAIQLNQLGYSVMYQHDQSVSDEARKQADNSFANMVVNLRKFPYYEKNSHQQLEVQVTNEERVEMILSRLVMQVGSFPSRKIENIVRKIFGIAELPMRSEGKGPDDPNDSKMLEVLKNMFKIPEGD